MRSLFPKHIASRGIVIYLLSLAIVSLMYMKYAMPLYYAVIGMVFVVVFFTYVPRLSSQTARYSESDFVHKIFWTAFALRIVWVIFSYFFYKSQTGIPFEFGAADSQAYHDEAKWLANSPLSTSIRYYSGRGGISDVGYTAYLQLVYRIFGPSIIIARIFKAIWGSWTCVLLYRLAERNIGFTPARLAAIIAVFMPNLIVYCGLHLKETEMIFLMVAFLERTDKLLRQRKYGLKDIILPLLLAGSLFFFRTVLGLAALFSFVTALLFMPERSLGKKGKRAMLIGWSALEITVLAGGVIYSEAEDLWNRKEGTHSGQRNTQYETNKWATYATGVVLAPMEFVVPFATMVETEGQQQQLILSGGNFVRNYMGIFVLIALYIALIVNGEWRELSLIGSFTIVYLIIIAFSQFGNSERFLLPGLPGIIVFWAYGLSHLGHKTYKLIGGWSVLVVVMEVAWAYFKLGGRGLI